ncbi:mucin-17-like [Seriola lalandi dorsalis]|uniref:mucin-17-like n=1 Tax=Seriola lalandi dorsalis TaxID=1841481 RepID=UPI000C6FAAAA|nr:mucin-17-like [Seriola lalandi dorsalis]
METEPTGQTNASTSLPEETTLIPNPTGPTEPRTSDPSHTTAGPEPSTPTNKVTSESAETTSSADTTSTTDNQPTGAPSSPSTVPQTTTSSISPTEPPTSVPTTKPNTPSTKPPTDEPITSPTTPPATPTAQTTTRPFTTAEPLTCQNGGTFNGFNCTCLIGFSGKICQFVETLQPDTFTRSVEVNLVIDQEFNEKYEDTSSSQYIEFVRNFTRQMETYYREKKIANFKEVLVTRVSRGGPLGRFSDNTVEQMRLSDEAMAAYSVTPRADSVNVFHDVVLGIPNNGSSDQLYDDDFVAVKDAVDELVGCTVDCPYNVTTTPIVDKTKVDVGSVCKRSAEDDDVADHYEIVHVDGVLTCVTVCDSLHSRPKRCFNKGICRLYRFTGPLCECQTLNSTWYLGNDCRFPIQRTPFYAGLSVTLICLLVTVVALTAYVLINKHKRRDFREMQVNQWLNEDFEWSRSDSSTDTYNIGEYRNPSFTHEESDGQPVPVYQLNQPSLDTDDTQSSPSVSIYSPSQTGNNTPFSHGSQALPHRDLSSNLPMRISRPQIRISSDA